MNAKLKKIIVLLVIANLGVILFSFFYPEYDNLFIPLMQFIMAIILLTLGISQFKEKNKIPAIICLIVFAFLMFVLIAKYVFN
jgi:predicted branched-subunit amino acid permease